MSSATKPGASTPLSSAGWCYGCGVWTEKRYGGEGRYFAYCSLCWSGDLPELDARAHDTESPAVGEGR